MFLTAERALLGAEDTVFWGETEVEGLIQYLQTPWQYYLEGGDGRSL